MSDRFREYATLVLQRHSKLLEGAHDSSIEEIEDRLDAIWPELDEVQRTSLKGMESDLNWIRRNGELPPKGRKTHADVSESELVELSTAIRSKDWHYVLHLLRICAASIPAASLALDRSIAYRAIGLDDYFVEFLDFAERLEPSASVRVE
jgi:hypothetical protein